MKIIGSIIYLFWSIATSMVGYQVNLNEHSICPLFWAFLDFCFTFIPWVKWLIFHQVNLSLLKHTFAFFLQ